MFIAKKKSNSREQDDEKNSEASNFTREDDMAEVDNNATAKSPSLSLSLTGGTTATYKEPLDSRSASEAASSVAVPESIDKVKELIKPETKPTETSSDVSTTVERPIISIDNPSLSEETKEPEIGNRNEKVEACVGRSSIDSKFNGYEEWNVHQVQEWLKLHNLYTLSNK